MVRLITKQVVEHRDETKQLVEMSDAHCHLDLIDDYSVISRAVDSGVLTMITDGVDTKSNMRALVLANGKHIFPAIGIDPEHAIAMKDKEFEQELEFNLDLVKQNVGKIAAIGEIGLDYKISSMAEGSKRQLKVFEAFLDLSLSLDLPVSVHARDAIGEVLKVLEEKGIKRAHLHYFEGGEAEAKRAERFGYMISVPPLESNKRSKAIKAVSIETLMVESDSPIVGESPGAVERSVGIIASAKQLPFNDVAWMTTGNAKRFFGIGKLMSARLMR